jgi:hypothetical protein
MTQGGWIRPQFRESGVVVKKWRKPYLKARESLELHQGSLYHIPGCNEFLPHPSCRPVYLHRQHVLYPLPLHPCKFPHSSVPVPSPPPPPLRSSQHCCLTLFCHPFMISAVQKACATGTLPQALTSQRYPFRSDESVRLSCPI